MSKNIIVFGSTGNTGLCCLKAALDLGQNVTAFVRDPSLLPSEIAQKVKSFKGDVLDVKSIEEALKDQDKVVIALGTRNDVSPTTVLSEGTKNILNAMKKFAIDKVSVCLSAFLFMEDSKVPERFHDLNADHKRMLNVLKESDRKWVAVLPPHIADEPAKGDYIVEVDKKAPLRTISKYDLGHFLVSCLDTDKYFGKCCGICDKPKE